MAKRIFVKGVPREVIVIFILTYIVSSVMVFFGGWFALDFIYKRGDMGVSLFGIILFLIGGLFAFRVAGSLRSGESYARKSAVAIYTTLVVVAFLVFNEVYTGLTPSKDSILIVLSLIAIAVCTSVVVYLLKNKEKFH